jgi:D-alanine transaminase
VPPPGLRGNLFAVRLELPRVPGVFRSRGADVITTPDERWHGAHIKSTNLLASVLARTRAARAGAWEAVLYRGRGPNARVTEATGSSVFLFRSGALATPAVRGLLPGITRGALLQVAREAGIPVEERSVRLEELRRADEAFLTATSVEILPIARIDGERLRLRAPGPMTKRLAVAFARFRRKALAETPRIARL